MGGGRKREVFHNEEWRGERASERERDGKGKKETVGTRPTMKGIPEMQEEQETIAPLLYPSVFLFCYFGLHFSVSSFFFSCFF